MNNCIQKQIREFTRDRKLDIPLQCIEIKYRKPQNIKEVLVIRANETREDILKYYPEVKTNENNIFNLSIARIIASYFIRTHRLNNIRYFGHTNRSFGGADSGNRKNVGCGNCRLGCGAFLQDDTLFLHFDENEMHKAIRSSSRLPAQRIIIEDLNAIELNNYLDIYVYAILAIIASIESSIFTDLREKSREYTLHEIVYNNEKNLSVTNVRMRRVGTVPTSDISSNNLNNVKNILPF